MRNRAAGRNVRGRTITGRLRQGSRCSGRSVLMVCIDSMKRYYEDIKRDYKDIKRRYRWFVEIVYIDRWG